MVIKSQNKILNSRFVEEKMYFLFLQGGTVCPCKRRGSRWFIAGAFGTLSTSEGGACFRKFAYIIKLRPMLRDSGEWFVSTAKYFFILFSRTTFFHPSLFIYIYYLHVYITVAFKRLYAWQYLQTIFFFF